MTDFDVAIVGAGIAGASLAGELAGSKRVLLLEAEAHPGYHATGRSAAFWTESYGGPAIQPLTTASGPLLAAPPPEFHERSFLRKRGALHIGQTADQELADALLADFSSSGVAIKSLEAFEISQKIPAVREDWTLGLWEVDCCDIDVAALHGAYLRQASRGGAKLLCNARMGSAKYAGGAWEIETTTGQFTAKTLVNAAGAWADEAARISGIRMLDIKPYRRTVVQLAMAEKVPDDLPLVVGLDGSFYFKPDTAGRIWLSPHDEALSPACDAAPEEIDVAIAIDRFQQVMESEITRVEHKWAGLRSFAPDRLPIIGRDPDCPEFFWLAGQGGFGIQTAPAVAKLAFSLLLDDRTPLENIAAATYAPERFR